MSEPLIAVLDVGKTNARLELLDPARGTSVWKASRTNAAGPDGPLRQLDIVGIETWVTRTLAALPDRARITAIVPVAHGAAAVLLDESGAVLLAPDYEDPRFDSVAEEYAAVRDPFARTFSPQLPCGLNLGRQLFYLEHREPALFARVAHVVPFPQYWAWRLSGTLAREVTSLGCHSDLWAPAERKFSHLATRMRWTGLFPACRFAGDALGNIEPAVAAATGLNSNCKVMCGLHDSNVSYLEHLLAEPQGNFAVVSSGTWTIVMANQARLAKLQDHLDMLANVDVFGAPVGTARFMGGREFEAIAPQAAQAPVEALCTVLKRRAMALPAFALGGPFAGVAGSLEHAASLTDSERAALATLYVALMSDLLIDMLGACEPTIYLDGPLARNHLFGAILSALRADAPVYSNEHGAGPCRALCYLGGFPETPAPSKKRSPPLPLPLPQLGLYRKEWRERVTAPT